MVIVSPPVGSKRHADSSDSNSQRTAPQPFGGSASPGRPATRHSFMWPFGDLNQKKCIGWPGKGGRGLAMASNASELDGGSLSNNHSGESERLHARLAAGTHRTIPQPASRLANRMTTRWRITLELSGPSGRRSMIVHRRYPAKVRLSE